MGAVLPRLCGSHGLQKRPCWRPALARRSRELLHPEESLRHAKKRVAQWPGAAFSVAARCRSMSTDCRLIDRHSFETLFLNRKYTVRNRIAMKSPMVVLTSDSYTPLARSPGVGAFSVSITWKDEIMPVTVPSRPSSGATFPISDRYEILVFSLNVSSFAAASRPAIRSRSPASLSPSRGPTPFDRVSG